MFLNAIMMKHFFFVKHDAMERPAKHGTAIHTNFIILQPDLRIFFIFMQVIRWCVTEYDCFTRIIFT